MKVRINETGEINDLSIIDPKSGVNWINDLMGNHGALPDYDDDNGIYPMSRDDFEWWADFCKDLQTAEDRAHEIRRTIDNSKYEDFLHALGDFSGDLEDNPAHIQAVCDEYEDFCD